MNITSQKLEDDGTLTVLFNVDKTTTLNYSLPENVPMLKGRLAFKNNNAQKLSKAKLQLLDRKNSEVKKDLQSYIKEPMQSFNSLKLVCKVENGKLKENSVLLYSEGPLSDYKPYKLDDIPTEAVAEEQAYSATNATVENNIAPLSTTSIYNRFTARDYANTYTSSATGSLNTIVSTSGLVASLVLIVMVLTLTRYWYLLVGSSLIFASFSSFLQILRFIESNSYCPTCIIVTIIFDTVFVGLTFSHFHFENLYVRS